MAVKDLKRLLLKYESNLANKANYNASKLARVNTYNNRDYVVDLSKKTIIKNTKDNIRVAGRDEPTAAELENIWERTIASIKAAIPPFGGTGNKSVGGAGQFKVTWNSSNTIMYIKNVKNDPWSGQSTHTFLLKLRQKLEKEVWGFNVGSVANKKRGTSTTAGVDIELRHMLWDYLTDLNKDGKTILLTTHYIEEAERLCNEIAIINDGKIIKRGDTKSIIKEVSLNTIEIELKDPSTINLSSDINYIINDNILTIQSQEVNKDIVKVIEQLEKTTEIENINIINSSLEDAFIKLIN